MLPRHRHVRRRLLLLANPLPLSTMATPAISPPLPTPSTSSSSAFPVAPGPDPATLAPDDAIALLPSVAAAEGSAAALSLFRRLTTRPDLRHLMRLYATAATLFVSRGNLPMAHECARAMVAAFAERGRIREATDMLLELRTHGLPLAVETANWVLRVGLLHPGCFTHAREAFDGMTRANAVRPDARSYRALVLGCCRDGRYQDADALLAAMWEQGFALDSATCTAVVRAFCAQGRFRDVSDMFRRMAETGAPPNVVNYTAWIDGLRKRGHVKQAFHVLEEMVRRGLKPNVYTHTSLIGGLCRIRWTERAFQLFLRLVKSSAYKPNIPAA